MEDWFEAYARAFDIDNLHYDVPPITYHNPRRKGYPELHTLAEFGFPDDVNEAPYYYNYALSEEFYQKTRNHWKRGLPEFKDNFLKYLLTWNSRDKALEQFYRDCAPYGISQEEADNYLQDRMFYFLEPDNALAVVKELVFLILEYAPNDYSYFVRCYGLKNSFVYKGLYHTAAEIIRIRTNDALLMPRVIQREIRKGTPLIEIYHHIFENKSVIKDTLKAFRRSDFDTMPVGFYERKIERILLSQSNLDYTVNETKAGIPFNYCLYENGDFLFAIKYDGSLFSYDDEDTIDNFEQYFNEQIKEIRAFDDACLEKGIPVYHISDYNLDDDYDHEHETEVADDIRKAKKDINYLRSMIENGWQYDDIINAANDYYDDDWDWE